MKKPSYLTQKFNNKKGKIKLRDWNSKQNIRFEKYIYYRIRMKKVTLSKISTFYFENI